MQTCKPIRVIVSLLILISCVAKAADIKVSGGENHTLVLTANKQTWACGFNWWRQLGTGDNYDRWTLVQVHGPDDVGYLEDINNVSAGWTHSLALDVNDFVWAWGEILVKFV